MDYLTGLVYSDFNFFMFVAPRLIRLLQGSRDVLIGTVKKTTELVRQAQ